MTRASAATGAVTPIQRFGSALNLNIHFHMLFLDGVYVGEEMGLRFVPVPAPSRAALEGLVQTIAERVGRSLEHAGLITRDIENAYLAFDPSEETPIHSLLGHSITYRIATGPREGQKVFTLQTLAPDTDRSSANVAESSGFSLHAGVAAKSAERDRLEHLARYVSRPPIATERLALTDSGQVRYTLKTPYRDGATHAIFEPMDFIARQSLDPAHPSRAPPQACLPIRSNAIRAKQALARAGSASPRAVRQSRRRFLPRRGDSQGRSNAVGWQRSPTRPNAHRVTPSSTLSAAPIRLP